MLANVKVALVVLLVYFGEFLPRRDSSGGGVLSQVYGPHQTSGNPGTDYGPPAFKPGEPLDYTMYTRSESKSEKQIVGSQACRNMDPEHNRNLVEGFYRISLEEKKPELLPMYLAEDYLNHSPYSEKPGRDDFHRILTGPFANEPSQKVRFLRITPVDDIVWAHSTWMLNGIKYSVMDLWTVNCDGLLQEHWDVLQDTKIPTRNPVAFF